MNCRMSQPQYIVHHWYKGLANMDFGMLFEEKLIIIIVLITHQVPFTEMMDLELG